MVILSVAAMASLFSGKVVAGLERHGHHVKALLITQTPQNTRLSASDIIKLCPNLINIGFWGAFEEPLSIISPIL